jgi:peptidoglycan/xylan/chitin deacetylase (PgdA/CDA1 family)
VIAKKELMARMLVKAGLMGGLASVHHLVNKDIKILAYHRVLPREPEEGFPYDLELVSAWADEFDWQMAYLAKHYQVITCHELAGFMDAGVWPDKPCVMVTFDDGYLDNHDVALPILQRHGLPAVVFVTTGYIGGEGTFWYDQLVHEVLHSQANRLMLTPGGEHVDLGHGEAARRVACTRLLRHMKRVSNDERLATLARWHDDLGVNSKPDPASQHRPMNWTHVKALSDAGVEIGSHTVTHPVLSRIQDVEHLKREFAASKEAIEAHLGKPVLSVAYPTGGRTAYTEQVMACAEQCGYRFAFTYEGGVNRAETWHPYRLRRSAVERYSTRERFQAVLAAPGFF